MLKSFSFLIVLTLIYSSCLGQTAVTPTIQFENNNLQISNLPYGQAFIIKGNVETVSKDERIESISLSIIQTNNSGYKNIDTLMFNEKWFRKNESDSIFEFKCPLKLLPDDNYKIIFGFETANKSLDESIQKRAIEDLHNRLFELYKAQGGIIEQQTKVEIQKFIKELQSLIPVTEEGLKSKVKINIDPYWSKELNSLAQNSNAILNSNDIILIKIKEIYSALNKYDSMPDSVKSKSEGVVLKTEILKIKNAFQNNTSYNENVLNLTNVSKLDGIVRELQSAFAQLHIEETAKEGFVTDKGKIETKINSIEASMLQNASYKFIEQVYINRDTEICSSDYERILSLGLKTGLAYSSLNNDQSAWFPYTTIRFYFLPVDKRINAPYGKIGKSSYSIRRHLLRRTSISLGTVLGNLKYKGQDLKNLPTLDFKLITALSFDISKYFTFDFGATWFEQPNNLPFQDYNKTRASLFMGISFDFNIIETIKK